MASALPAPDAPAGDGCGAAAPEPTAINDALLPRSTADGSPSLWSARFGEGFHCGQGALAEARLKFVAPAQLEHFATGSLLRVVEVGVGLGYNSAALLEAAQRRGLRLQWWGLELDPRPLALALAEPGFRRLWQPGILALLEQLAQRGEWREEALGEGRWLLGDARQRLPDLLAEIGGRCDLVLHDAFSPGRCPQLWSLEFLSALARLLHPQGRLLTYCSAAAVRQALREAGLQLASLQEIGPLAPADEPPAQVRQPWSLGTAASPTPLPCGGPLRPLGPMEWEHLATRAAEPYRDPTGTAEAQSILAARKQAQNDSGGASTSAWRQRWAGAHRIRRGGSAPGTASGPPPVPAARPAGAEPPCPPPDPLHPPG